ncbi:patatin-like phospholipase family protein [Spirochaetota bacterium]
MINPLKYFRNRTVGLVLGSGGSKGIAHISVIEYLESMGIPINMIAGSSMGAIIGTIYSLGCLKKFKEDLLKISRKDMMSIFDPVFPRSGLIAGKSIVDFLKRYIPNDANIEDLKIPMSIVATDYYNGRSVIFRSGNILEAIRASISLPGILVPVRFKSTFLIDGGVANPLPINVVKSMGAGITIAVNLHPRLNEKKFKKYIKLKNERWKSIIDASDIEIIEDHDDIDCGIPHKNVGWLHSVENWLGVGREKKKQKDDFEVPNIFEIISQTVDIMEYVNTMLMLKYGPPNVLIEPKVMDIPTLDFTKSAAVITEGFLACAKAKKSLIRKVKMWI